MTTKDITDMLHGIEPDPPSPDERYDHATEVLRRDWQATSWVHGLDALRDMIASLDAEVARLTETVNRQDKRLDDYGLRLSATQGRIAALS